MDSLTLRRATLDPSMVGMDVGQNVTEQNVSGQNVTDKMLQKKCHTDKMSEEKMSHRQNVP